MLNGIIDQLLARLASPKEGRRRLAWRLAAGAQGGENLSLASLALLLYCCC
jgi:hypothetical protein